MTRGVVLFGVNNASIDYIQLAIIAAGFIRKNMPGVPIALITDQSSKEYHDGKGRWPISTFFEHCIILPPNVQQRFENKRMYRDTRYHQVEDTFKNETRSSAYDLSPFDETLLIDVDYLVCNDVLNGVWGSSEDIMIGRDASNLMHEPLVGNEYRVNPFGIRMYWATVIFFRKSEKARILFDLVDHIKENWEFYAMLYELPGRLYRNDFAFSIAIHLLSGFVEDEPVVAPLPLSTIHTALDTDQFYDIKSPTEMRFFANDSKENWKFFMTRLKGINVHCMNKLSLLNNVEDIMEVLS